jgi:hypothetical protein
MGDVTIRVTNTLDQGAGDESIGYGKMKLEYEFGGFDFVLPTESPVNVDEGVTNPTSLWQNDCGATEKTCSGFDYYGGTNECGQGDQIWRTFGNFHPGANRVTFKGKIWTIDSWDNEFFTVQILDQAGNVMATEDYQGNNFNQNADETVQCENTVGGWADGFFRVELSSEYNTDQGDVTVRITNTLDQGLGDESIGYGDMYFEYEFDNGERLYSTENNPENYDWNEENPTGLWENDCGATIKECAGFSYYGGYNECA